MTDVGRQPVRSKDATLAMLKRRLGARNMAELDRKRLLMFGRERAAKGARQNLKIDDLHFYDLRHEGASRLFEAGFELQHVALVTGHKDWKMLRSCTHLTSEALHAVAN